GLAVVDRNRRPAVFQVALVLVVAEYDEGIELGGAQYLAQALRRRAGGILSGDQLLRRNHVGELWVGLDQKLVVAGRVALLVAVLHLHVGFEKARQRFVRRKQHGGMRRPHAEHDPGHWFSPLGGCILASLRAEAKQSRPSWRYAWIASSLRLPRN